MPRLSLSAFNRALVVLSMVISMPLWAAPGDVDTTFGSAGFVTTDFDSGARDQASSVIQQADGKIVAAGNSNDPAEHYRFALSRYSLDGTLDTSFGGDGKVTTFIGTVFGEGAFANSVLQQTDGKLVAAGWALNNGNQDFALARYNNDGSLDTTFDGDGKLTTVIGAGYDHANSIIQQADGKLLVVGNVDNGSNMDIGVVRYNLNGTLDTTFSGDGKLIISVGTETDWASDVLQQSDGKIVIVGHSNNLGSSSDFAAVRLTSSGVLDSTFSGDGKVTTPVGSGRDESYSIIQQPDGKLVLAGFTASGLSTGSDFALVRYLANGSLDTAFGAGGKVVTAFVNEATGSTGLVDDEAHSLIQQSDGKLVLAGYSNRSQLGVDFAIARYSLDGSLDQSFSGDGMAVPDHSESRKGASVLQQRDGRLVLTGEAQVGGNEDFGLLRIKSGQPDTDSDGILDALDPDDDGDSIPDGSDNCSLMNNADQYNFDGDSQGDACDLDDDNDSVPDTLDVFPNDPAEWTDFDGDLIGDNGDNDDDNDGIPDNYDPFPFNPNSVFTIDGIYKGSVIKDHVRFQ